MPGPVRVLLAAVLLALGTVTAIATVAVHGWTWGLALGLAATFATVPALAPGWSTRLAFVVGWAGFVGYAAVPRREGDYLIAADAAGYTLLVAGLVLILVGVLTLPRPRRVAGPPSPPT